MESINPYASPKTSIAAAPAANDPSGIFGVWRSGGLLVVVPNAQLPNRCVKCNGPTDANHIRFKMAWHSPVAYFGLLLGLIPYIILAIVLQKKLTVDVSVCGHHRRRRRNAVWMAWLGAVAAFVLMILGGASLRQPASGMSIVAGFALLIFSIFYGVLAFRIIWPKRIDGQRAWVKGVCREYLATFPEYMQ